MGKGRDKRKKNADKNQRRNGSGKPTKTVETAESPPDLKKG